MDTEIVVPVSPEHATHEHEHEWLAYGLSLLFALLGAILLSFGRLKDECIPHEADTDEEDAESEEHLSPLAMVLPPSHNHHDES